MQRAFRQALGQAEEILRDLNWEEYEKLLFLSKSVGTAVAAAYAGQRKLPAKNIFFTPVEETFAFVEQPGIVFHGTGDPWARTSRVEQLCREKKLPLYLTEGANHSMETGDVLKDLETMKQIMEQCEVYLSGI